jgi:hypothetical protein
MIMNKKKKEEKRKARGLLTFDEHMQKREEAMQKSWEKSSKKNKGKKPFGK